MGLWVGGAGVSFSGRLSCLLGVVGDWEGGWSESAGVVVQVVWFLGVVGNWRGGLLIGSAGVYVRLACLHDVLVGWWRRRV